MARADFGCIVYFISTTSVREKSRCRYGCSKCAYEYIYEKKADINTMVSLSMTDTRLLSRSKQFFNIRATLKSETIMALKSSFFSSTKYLMTICH